MSLHTAQAEPGAVQHDYHHNEVICFAKQFSIYTFRVENEKKSRGKKKMKRRTKDLFKLSCAVILTPRAQQCA